MESCKKKKKTASPRVHYQAKTPFFFTKKRGKMKGKRIHIHGEVEREIQVLATELLFSCSVPLTL